jgi:hypothetical protein
VLHTPIIGRASTTGKLCIGRDGSISILTFDSLLAEKRGGFSTLNEGNGELAGSDER